MYRLERTQYIARPRHEVFQFFADAANLESLTPDFLHFRILTPLPICMQPGTIIDYRLRLFGMPFAWRTRIAVYDPPHCFTDVQVRGPYRYWYHLHTFSDASEGTCMVDRVTYGLPLGALGRLLHRLWVHRTLEAIFDYRQGRLQERFA